MIAEAPTLEAPTSPSFDILHDPLGNGGDGSTMIPGGGGREAPSFIAPVPATAKDEGCRNRIYSSAEVLRKTRERLGDPGAGHYWDRFVQARAVTLLIGETSAGKTVFLHNLAYHLATGTEFLGISPPRRLRVLHVDFESYDEIYANHLSVIGIADGWDFLWDLEELPRGPDFLREMKRAVTHYDVIIVDPLMEAYPLKDENDNAAANTQMLGFRDLARSTNTAVIVVHNSGLRRSGRRKDPGGDKFMGRGATSRVDRADFSINFTAQSSTVRLLTVKKSRGKGLNRQFRCRFADELGYELISDSEREEERANPSQKAAVIEFVESETSTGHVVVERKAIMSRLGINEHSAESQSLDRTLRDCVGDGSLHRIRKGVYSLSASSCDTPQKDPSEAPEFEGGADERSSGATPEDSQHTTKGTAT